VTASTWNNDVEQLLTWAKADERFIARVGARLGEDERAVLQAIVTTRGDLKSMVQQLGPLALAKLRARVHVPDRFRGGANRAWKILEVPLKQSWSPQNPEALAQEFFGRYGAKVETLTGEATRAAVAAKAVATTLKAFAGTKDLVKAAAQLSAQADRLEASVSRCIHHERAERAAWLGTSGSITHEGIQTVESVRAMTARAKEYAQHIESIARSLDDWTKASVGERAATAPAMAEYVRAAAQAAAEMQEKFLDALFARA
jgi:hypothetical protein